MLAPAEKTAAFRALHIPGKPFVIPNPWDAGSARILAGLGFKALATTSSGIALTLGRTDYAITRAESLDGARAVVDAVDIPVTADLENGFGLTPEDAAETIRLGAETGLCGASIEDSTGARDNPIIDKAVAAERIAAAAEAAKSAGNGFMLTARAEGFLHGQNDLDAIIARLQAFEANGADVLYAPGLPDMDAVRAVCAGVSKPVNILIIGSLAKHTVEDFAVAGAARLSIGGGLAWRAYAALASAQTMVSEGRFDALQTAPEGVKTIAGHLQR